LSAHYFIEAVVLSTRSGGNFASWRCVIQQSIPTSPGLIHSYKGAIHSQRIVAVSSDFHRETLPGMRLIRGDYLWALPALAFFR
jgi:hypothetical protein